MRNVPPLVFTRTAAGIDSPAASMLYCKKTAAACPQAREKKMIRTEENSVIFHNGYETVRVDAWGSSALRVRATVNPHFTDKDWALHAEDKGSGSITPLGQGVSLQNGKARVCIDEDGNLCFMNRQGETVLKEYPRVGSRDNEQFYAHALPAREYKKPCGELYATCVRFKSDSHEKIFGMGQYQQEELDLKGCILELAQRNSQVSIPFFVSDQGYGFLWNNPAIGSVSFGRNYTEWFAERTAQIDYLVIMGDTPAEILGQYMKLTGLPPMMPEYGLGFWQCRLRYASQSELLEVAHRYFDMGMAPDVIIVDYFHWTKQGEYRFDPKFWPDPEGMCRELAEMNIRLMVSVWPTVDKQAETFGEMAQNGYLTRCENGLRYTMDFIGKTVFYDATNPDARDYVWKRIKENYYDKGAKLYWLDADEPEYTTYDYANYRYMLGTVLEVGNIYPKMLLKGIADGKAACGEKEQISLTRSAWAGSAAYGALVWSGDIPSTFTSFRRQISAGLNMAMAGIPWWTTDIGGFHGACGDDPAFRELLARWTAYGCFCPVMRFHGSRQPFHDVPGSEEVTGAGNEIWSFGEEMQAILTKYIRLRESLRPYIREQMALAHTDGTPVMRPLFYDFPGDKTSWEIEDEYMFGPEYLVAPVYEQGAVSRRVYLPESRWENIHTHECLSGGRYTVDAPLDVIPVFRRIR